MNKQNELISLIELYEGKVTDLRGILKEKLFSEIEKYPGNWKFYQKVYHELYLDKSEMVPTCTVCNQTALRFVGLRKGYTKSCSYSCRNNHPERIKRYKKSCLSRYGTEFASQSNKFRDTVKQTLIKKYNISNPMHSQKFKNKMIETNRKRYGVDNVAQSPDVIEKMRK